MKAPEWQNKKMLTLSVYQETKESYKHTISMHLPFTARCFPACSWCFITLKIQHDKCLLSARHRNACEYWPIPPCICWVCPHILHPEEVPMPSSPHSWRWSLAMDTILACHCSSRTSWPLWAGTGSVASPDHARWESLTFSGKGLQPLKDETTAISAVFVGSRCHFHYLCRQRL